MAARTQHTPKRTQSSKMSAVNEPHSGSKKQQEENAIPIWEWIVAAIGFMMVASVIGFLLYEAIGGYRLPPDVKLTVDSVVQTRNGYLAKITAVNEGGMTAAGVVIEGALSRGAEPVERSWTTIDYLPPRSEQRGGLFFTRDPREFNLQVRPSGYVEP